MPAEYAGVCKEIECKNDAHKMHTIPSRNESKKVMMNKGNKVLWHFLKKYVKNYKICLKTQGDFGINDCLHLC